jgi:hypothetical protein
MQASSPMIDCTGAAKGKRVENAREEVASKGHGRVGRDTPRGSADTVAQVRRQAVQLPRFGTGVPKREWPEEVWKPGLA